jgi:cytosine/adenosine deaminase-related metal-dependent hydrolase
VTPSLKYGRTAAVICGCLLAVSCTDSSRVLVLEGTIVAPDRIIDRGWMVIQNGTIRRILEQPPDGEVRAIRVDGVIVPGLIDLHNHLAWNALPSWSPKRQYANRYEWRNAYEYEELIARPARSLQQQNNCDVNEYGALRALVGGTTSIQASSRSPCIDTLVRNLDAQPDPDVGVGWDVPFDQILDIANASDAEKRRVAQRMARGTTHALFVHLAEGRPGDEASRDEFDALVSAGLLGKKTVVIHGTALREREFQKMAEAGASLVWSPRSNISLYGETTDVVAARERGIEIALAPDWAVTGSASLLAELAYAARFNRDRLAGRFTDEELIAMVTGAPARIAGIADRVGSLREGFDADLLVVREVSRSPYRSLIDARPQDIRLVLVAGEAVYGAPDLMRQLAQPSSIEELTVCGTGMALRISSDGTSGPGARERLATVEQRLKRGMTRVGPWLTLAPLAICQ